MAATTDQAAVLRLTEYSEASQIATFFTARAGQVRLIAKGIRRGTRTRFAAGLDLLEIGELSYTPARGTAGLGNLTGWVQRDAFSALRLDLARLHAGLYLAELVAVLTQEYDPHGGLFRAIVRTLEALEGACGVGTAIVEFQRDLLSAIGYLPELSRCMDCGRPPVRGEPAYFSSSCGGVICRDCEPHHVEKRRLPAGLTGIATVPGNARELFELWDYHLAHIAGRKLKMSDKVLNHLRARGDRIQ